MESTQAPLPPVTAVSAVDPGTARTRAVLDLRQWRMSLPSGDIAYIDEGCGPVILLPHGVPLTAIGFVRVIHELRSRYRVVAPDLPGFGASIAATGFTASLDAYARSIEEFCRALELTGLVAYLNDSSACIGLAALSRFDGGIVGLVIADAVPLPLTGRFSLVKFVLRHVVSSRLVRALNRRVNLLPWLVVSVAPWLNRFSPEERKVLLAQFDTTSKRERVIDLFQEMGRDDQFMHAVGKQAAARFADTPVLLLYGQFDPMRLIGAIPRFKRMFPRHAVVPRSRSRKRWRSATA